MSNARLRPRLTLPAALVASLLIASGLPPGAASCPAEPPSPLRQLYAESELVVVARVGDAVAASKDEHSTLFRIALHVSKTLKGDGKERTLPFHYQQWGDEAEWPAQFEKGQTLLLFLKRRDEGDGYALTDYRYAAKKLSDEHLKVYVRRIEELAAIVARGKPDAAEITEWLVRCAEEPATRWEGAYELALYADVPSGEEGTAPAGGGDSPASHLPPAPAADRPKVADAATDEKAPDQTAPQEAAPATDGEKHHGVSVDAIMKLPVVRASPEPDYAALLTPLQKQRLAASLFGAEELGEGELTLLPLAARWGDERLAPFVLKHLEGMADKPPYEAEMLMHLAARALGDRGLVKFATDYSAGAAYDDLGLPEEDEVGDDEESRKMLAEMRAAAAEALNWRSTKVYHFLALAQQPQKP